jgi:hypothetical protein
MGDIHQPTHHYPLISFNRRILAMTTTTAQQQARTWVQNATFIIVTILAFAIFVYVYNNRILNVEPPVPSEVIFVSPAPAPVPVLPADVLFQEGFDTDTSASWDMSIAGQAHIERGVMVLDDNQYNGPAFAQPHLLFDDVVIQAHTRWLTGAFGGRYGFQFRVQEQQDGDYYAFYIRNDGRYTIGKYMQGNWFTINEQFTDAIIRGGQVNLLRVEANGANLRFFINDTYIGDVTNEALGAGDVRLVAERAAGDTNSFAVAFDNIVISRHPER